MKPRSLLPIVALSLMVFTVGTTEAAQAPCTPAAGAAVAGAASNAIAADRAAEQNAINQFVQSPVTSSSGSSSGPFGCVASLWPGAAGGFHIPTMDQIINGVLTAQIQKACNAARSEISQATSGLSSSVAINTGIAGMPSIGANLNPTMGASNLVSVNGSGAGSTGGIGGAVNGAVSSANSAVGSAVSSVSSPVNGVVNSATSSANSAASSGWSTIKSLF